MLFAVSKEFEPFLFTFSIFFLIPAALVTFYIYPAEIMRGLWILFCLPFHIGKYVKKYYHAQAELQQALIKQVYEARTKIQGGNPLEGKLQIAMLGASYGKKRIAKILRETETWFSDV